MLKTLLFLRYTKASPLPSCSEPGMTEVNQVAQSLFALCECAGLLYFYVSGHANVLHSLYRARDEADKPVLSQVFLAFFTFFAYGNDICFFFFPSYWKPPKVIIPFLRATDHRLAVSSVSCFNTLEFHLIPWTFVCPSYLSGYQLDCPLLCIVLLFPNCRFSWWHKKPESRLCQQGLRQR